MDYTDESELSFYDKFRTYKIKKGDTLQSVAQELAIGARELRRYHNIYCRIEDLIEADFKRYSKFLILAPEKKVVDINTIEEKKPKKISLGNNYKLPFHPEGISRDYSVEYTFEVDGQIDTLEMGVRVNWLATPEEKYYLFEIHRSVNFFVDSHAPDIVMDELGLKIGEVLYPLKIVVDTSGKWIDIYNHKEIVSRWEHKKDEIFEYYEKEAKVTKRLIEFAEGALISSDALFESLSSDYFLRAFFNGIHVGYTADYVFENEVYFPLEKNEESVFKTEQKINPNLNKDGLIEVHQIGDYMNSDAAMSFSNKLWDGKYSASYYLDSYSCFIEKLNLECSIEYDEPIKISLTIESLKKEQTKSKKK